MTIIKLYADKIKSRSITEFIKKVNPENGKIFHIPVETIDPRAGEQVGEIEMLPCGHQNNLWLKDELGKPLRTIGICPKGDYP